MQKIKIGIFGDSYGYYDSRFSTKSWTQYLSEDYEITSYCKNGASTYLIYQEFLKHHEQYDKVIVLITYPGRIHTSILPIPGSGIAQFWTKLHEDTLSYEQKKVLRATGEFVDIIHFDEELTNQTILFHNLLIEKIKSFRSDILFVPCFSVSNTEFNRTCLYDISMMEQQFWGDKWKIVAKRNAQMYDERQCHMSNQNNFILYQQIKQELESMIGHKTFNIDLETFVQPDDISNYIPSKYYE
jgi:hypothetical protein